MSRKDSRVPKLMRCVLGDECGRSNSMRLAGGGNMRRRGFFMYKRGGGQHGAAYKSFKSRRVRTK